MGCVEVSNLSVTVFGKYRHSGVLIALAIFASQIVLESVGAGAQEPQLIPISFPRVRSQRLRIGRRDDRDVDVLSQVMSDAIPTVDKERAHRAWAGVLFSVHKLIDHH